LDERIKTTTKKQNYVEIGAYMKARNRSFWFLRYEALQSRGCDNI